jgi:hypothetical protein
METSARSKASEDARDLSQKAHRQAIGWLGFLLPWLLYLIAGARPTQGLGPWALLDSISAYYYTGAVGILVGILFALSLFLFTYRGYVDFSADRIIGKVSGAAALGVALFPTRPPPGVAAPAWWRSTTGVVHGLSAVTLFGSFILFALWLFRKSNRKRENQSADKRWRNDICLACGLAMIVFVVWAAIEGLNDRPIFWPEALAVEMFAISWLAKGAVHEPVVAMVQRMRKRNVPLGYSDVRD